MFVIKNNLYFVRHYRLLLFFIILTILKLNQILILKKIIKIHLKFLKNRWRSDIIFAKSVILTVTDEKGMSEYKN